MQNPGIDAFVEEELRASPRAAPGGRLHRRRRAGGVRAPDQRRSKAGRRSRRSRSGCRGPTRSSVGRSSARTLTAPRRSSGRWRACRWSRSSRSSRRQRRISSSSRAPSCAPGRTGSRGGFPARHRRRRRRAAARARSRDRLALGPALKPMTLRAVFEVARALSRHADHRGRGSAIGRGRGRGVARRRVGGPGGHRHPGRPVGARRGRAGRSSHYLKEKRLASPADLRGRLRVPAGFGAVESTRGDDVIPRPENPWSSRSTSSDLDAAERLAHRRSRPHVGMLKVGLELFWAHGPEAVRRIGSHAPVFADAKLHDIPNTVERAAANIARLGRGDAQRACARWRGDDARRAQTVPSAARPRPASRRRSSSP